MFKLYNSSSLVSVPLASIRDNVSSEIDDTVPITLKLSVADSSSFSVAFAIPHVSPKTTIIAIVIRKTSVGID